MPSRCIIKGCAKVTKQDGVSLHHFPREEHLKCIWIEEVRKNRPDWEGPCDWTGARQHSVLCSTHFRESDFVDNSLFKELTGMKKRRQLKPDAIPHIDGIFLYPGKIKGKKKKKSEGSKKSKRKNNKSKNSAPERQLEQEFSVSSVSDESGWEVNEDDDDYDDDDDDDGSGQAPDEDNAVIVNAEMGEVWEGDVQDETTTLVQEQIKLGAILLENLHKKQVSSEAVPKSVHQIPQEEDQDSNPLAECTTSSHTVKGTPSATVFGTQTVDDDAVELGSITRQQMDQDCTTSGSGGRSRKYSKSPPPLAPIPGLRSNNPSEIVPPTTKSQVNFHEKLGQTSRKRDDGITTLSSLIGNWNNIPTSASTLMPSSLGMGIAPGSLPEINKVKKQIHLNNAKSASAIDNRNNFAIPASSQMPPSLGMGNAPLLMPEIGLTDQNFASIFPQLSSFTGTSSNLPMTSPVQFSSNTGLITVPQSVPVFNSSVIFDNSSAKRHMSEQEFMTSGAKRLRTDQDNTVPSTPQIVQNMQSTQQGKKVFIIYAPAVNQTQTEHSIQVPGLGHGQGHGQAQGRAPSAGDPARCFTCQEELQSDDAMARSLLANRNGMKILHALRQMCWPGLYDIQKYWTQYCCGLCVNLLTEYIEAMKIINELKDSWKLRTGHNSAPYFIVRKQDLFSTRDVDRESDANTSNNPYTGESSKECGSIGKLSHMGSKLRNAKEQHKTHQVKGKKVTKSLQRVHQKVKKPGHMTQTWQGTDKENLTMPHSSLAQLHLKVSDQHQEGVPDNGSVLENTDTEETDTISCGDETQGSGQRSDREDLMNNGPNETSVIDNNAIRQGDKDKDIGMDKDIDKDVHKNNAELEGSGYRSSSSGQRDERDERSVCETDPGGNAIGSRDNHQNPVNGEVLNPGESLDLGPVQISGGSQSHPPDGSQSGHDSSESPCSTDHFIKEESDMDSSLLTSREARRGPVSQKPLFPGETSGKFSTSQTAGEDVISAVSKSQRSEETRKSASQHASSLKEYLGTLTGPMTRMSGISEQSEKFREETTQDLPQISGNEKQWDQDGRRYVSKDVSTKDNDMVVRIKEEPIDYVDDTSQAGGCHEPMDTFAADDEDTLDPSERR